MSSADTSVVSSAIAPLDDPLHVVVEDPIVVCAVEIVHCVVARPAQVAGGVSTLPVLVANLEVVGHGVFSRAEDVSRLKTLPFFQLLLVASNR